RAIVRDVPAEPDRARRDGRAHADAAALGSAGADWPDPARRGVTKARGASVIHSHRGLFRFRPPGRLGTSHGRFAAALGSLFATAGVTPKGVSRGLTGPQSSA